MKKQFLLATILTSLICGHSYAEEILTNAPPGDNGGQSLFSKVEGFQVVYIEDNGRVNTSTEPREPKPGESEVPKDWEQTRLADLVSFLTEGDTKVEFVQALGSKGEASKNSSSGEFTIKIASDISPAEQKITLEHELEHRNQMVNDGPLNFYIEGPDSIHGYGRSFHASEVSAYVASQSAYASNILRAAVTDPADVPRLISEYYERQATYRLETFNAANKGTGILLSVLSNNNLVTQLINDPEHDLELPHGGNFSLYVNKDGVSLNYFDGLESIAGISMEVKVSNVSEAISAIRNKLMTANDYLTSIAPGSPQDIASRNQADASIVLANQIINSGLELSIQSIATQAGYSNNIPGCTGGCAIAAGSAHTVISTNQVAIPAVLQNQSSKTAVAVQNELVKAAANVGGSVCQRMPWKCNNNDN